MEFNQNRGKDWTIDGGNSFIDEGTTPGSAKPLDEPLEIRGGDPKINDGLILSDGYIIAR